MFKPIWHFNAFQRDEELTRTSRTQFCGCQRPHCAVSLLLHKVKPPNLLVDCHMQQVKLADFGVSKILEASGYAGLDQTGTYWNNCNRSIDVRSCCSSLVFCSCSVVGTFIFFQGRSTTHSVARDELWPAHGYHVRNGTGDSSVPSSGVGLWKAIWATSGCVGIRYLPLDISWTSVIMFHHVSPCFIMFHLRSFHLLWIPYEAT